MKYVYTFHEGNKDMKSLLGGKGANLAEMTRLGLPVPKGFTITTEACKSYYDNQGKIKSEIVTEILNTIKELEKITGKTFGGGLNPLLISIRSGSPISMPGMMDTILNLGMNDTVASKMIELTQNPKFVYDSYRRFIMMYADVVKGYPKEIFEKRLEEYKQARNVAKDIELEAIDFKNLTEDYKKIYFEVQGKIFPEDPTRQILEAVSAVFRSWNNERAKYYRKMHNISDTLGTAVNIQEMVFGNYGENSGSGVAFTRNPATGEKELYGEYLMNAQGEDVVAGIRTPLPIKELKAQLPKIYDEFINYAKILENHYRDMQDMEFTIENNRLYMLQTRNGKRTKEAALKIAVDMVNENLLTQKEAILKLEPQQLENILHKSFEEEAIKDATLIAQGLAASPGASTGKICFSSKEVKERVRNDEKVILVRAETSPEDIEGMNDAEGILTIRGGMTSHAAVVARGLGICCVSGCEELWIDEMKKELHLKDGKVLTEENEISLDGSSGKVYYGSIPLQEEGTNDNLQIILSWIDEIETIKVRANADTEKDALIAKKMGATGIGLCRTEHMFFQKERIVSFRKMILAKTKEERIKALNEILPLQRVDFYKLFKAMAPNPIVIRYLDPPLHEFLPKNNEEISEMATILNISREEMLERIDSLKEFNPMMGHRGCRLIITYPEIAIMQTKAIMEAVIMLRQNNFRIKPEIMIPLTINKEEFDFVKKIVDDTASKIMKDNNVVIEYEIGTMIETPRACIEAGKIATQAQFFSFGTNDLTQLTFGFSRDDAGKFLKDYYQNKILENDPFVTIDQEGIGQLMNLAITAAKKENPKLSLGICGEHAADAKSVEFCYQLGLDYVSCSPYRIPMAKLAAAQAKLKKI